MSKAEIDTILQTLKKLNRSLYETQEDLKFLAEGLTNPKDSDVASKAKRDVEMARATLSTTVDSAVRNISRQLAKSAAYSPEYRPASPHSIRPVSPRGDLWNMTVSQLRDLARRRGVGGYTGKTKAELVAMLQ